MLFHFRNVVGDIINDVHVQVVRSALKRLGKCLRKKKKKQHMAEYITHARTHNTHARTHTHTCTGLATHVQVSHEPSGHATEEAVH